LDTDLEWVKAHTRLLTRAIEWGQHKHDYSFALHGSKLRSAETLVTLNQGQEPRLLPLQMDYILSSRRDANKRFSFAIGAAFLALTVVLFLGFSFWEKRKESALNLASNFREMGISELKNNNPLAAEVLFARALSINDNLGVRERLIGGPGTFPAPVVDQPTSSRNDRVGSKRRWDAVRYSGADASVDLEHIGQKKTTNVQIQGKFPGITSCRVWTKASPSGHWKCQQDRDFGFGVGFGAAHKNNSERPRRFQHGL
jgi:hypothetical protein